MATLDAKVTHTVNFASSSRGRSRVGLCRRPRLRRRAGGAALVAALLSSVALLPGPAAAAQASGDFDGDGYSDLAIGVPEKEVGGHLFAGAVHVLYGGPGGLGVAGNQRFTESTAGIRGPPVGFGDRFGWTLASGDFDGDRRDDLAIDAEAKTVDGEGYAGAVWVLYGGRNGLRAQGSRYLCEARGGIRSLPFEDEHFGLGLAAGNLVDGRPDDLAIGVPGERIPDAPNARWDGAVHVVPGSPRGLRPDRDHLLPGRGGYFFGASSGYGAALAIGDLDGDGHADLAVGSPGAKTFTGAVDVLYQRHHTLSAAHDRYLTENMPRMRGPGAGDHRFGWSVAIGRFNHRGAADLAIGVPSVPVRGYADGAVHILYGSRHRSLLRGDQYLTEFTNGMQGDPTQLRGGTNSFGHALAAGDFGGDRRDDLAIGAPDENVPQYSEGAVHVLYGARYHLTLAGDQYLTEEIPSLADDGPHEGDELGFALAAGNFDGDRRADLAIDKREFGDECDNAGGGTVHVLFGARDALRVSPNQAFSQETPGMLGPGSQPCDGFGMALAG